MILVDYSSFAISSIFAVTRDPKDMNEEIIRHVLLNQIALYRKKHTDTYGEIVFCRDSTNLWRRNEFPYYKAGRSKARNESDFDWNKIYNILDNIAEELKSVFGYKVVKVDTAEADDIIGILALNNPGPHLIISADKDFLQLKVTGDIEIYSSRDSSFVACADPAKFLQEHIMRGDSSDGIPNILSDDDTFVVQDKRQKRLTKNKISEIEGWFESKVIPDEYKENYMRNKKLISLFEIPETISDKIKDEYANLEVLPRQSLLKYFRENKLKNLFDKIGDF